VVTLPMTTRISTHSKRMNEMMSGSIYTCDLGIIGGSRGYSRCIHLRFSTGESRA
jgi:hypothetical protein